MMVYLIEPNAFPIFRVYKEHITTLNEEKQTDHRVSIGRLMLAISFPEMIRDNPEENVWINISSF